MPAFDSAWDDITDASELTATRWSDVINDLQSFLTNIDDTFFLAGALQPDKIDGTAMTLDDLSGGPTEQNITRQTRHTGELQHDGKVVWTSSGGEEVMKEIIVDPFVTPMPSVDGIRMLWLENNTGATRNVSRFEDGEAGQIITVVMYGTDNIQLLNTNPPTANNQILLQNSAATNIKFNAPTEEYVVKHFFFTNLNSTIPFTVWIELAGADLP